MSGSAFDEHRADRLARGETVDRATHSDVVEAMRRINARRRPDETPRAYVERLRAEHRSCD
jgi:hypothetical protein